MHQSSLPGYGQRRAPLRQPAVPRQYDRMDPRYGDDAFARFWAASDDSGHTSNGRRPSAQPTPSFGPTPRPRDGRRGVHRHARRAGRKRWLLVPVAAAAAILTGGIAVAATGAAGIQFRVASPVTVQALGVDISHAAVGQTVTAGAKVVAERTTTLSDVALAVKGPDGKRIDFPHVYGWKLGTSQKVLIRSKAFNRAGTYTYWFAYKKGTHWIGVGPRQTFTVGTPTSPAPGASTPAPTPSTPQPTPSGSTPAPTPSGSSSSGGSSGGGAPSGGSSTSPATNPALHGCASNPGSCGYPTTATAGVPAGTALTVINGDYTIKTNGAVLENKEIHGCVDVDAANVTIRNTRIIGQCFYGVSTYGATGTTVLDRVEINCVNGSGTGLAGPNFAAHAVYIHDCENGLEINNNSSVVDSVLAAREGTPAAHGDGIQSQDGNNVVIRHNTLLEINPVTSAIIAHATLYSGWVVEDNFMGGGAYTMYCPPQAANFVVRNNRFVPTKSGLYGSAYGLTDGCNHAGITWTGNYLDSNDSTVNP